MLLLASETGTRRRREGVGRQNHIRKKFFVTFVSTITYVHYFIPSSRPKTNKKKMEEETERRANVTFDASV